MDISSSGEAFHFYKLGGLVDTILNTNEISNLKDRYVLGEQLGWGRFGIIRACSDKLTGEVLACKSIAKDRLVTVADLSSVKLEIEIMTRLSGHPYVVNLKAVYEDEDYVHLLMELCAGGELFHQLEKHGRFSEDDARGIFRHLMQVVQYCHDHGIVHRDLKPENILLTTKSSSSAIKLADFGLATYIVPGHNLYGTVGSPFYIAPEVLVGGYNQAADVWSAGVILYILLSGVPPFWGKSKSRIFHAVRAADLRFRPDPWDQISASAKDLITKMLLVDPCKRLSAAQVLAHSWMQDCQQVVANRSHTHDNFDHGQLKMEGGYSSVPFITRVEDYSFNYTSLVTGEGQHEQSHDACLSSFSSFRVDDTAPCAASGGFSFSNCGESNAIEFSSPVTSMPSFTFFSQCSAVEKHDASLANEPVMSKMDAIRRESLLGNLFASQATSFSVRVRAEMMQSTEFRRDRNNGSRVSNIHNRRNHTIGLGELDQLETMVTESVIRWASCTRIPTASSLRLSLVC